MIVTISWCILLTLASAQENPIVDVKNGKLRGAIENPTADFTYFAFKGIPFAKPPLRDFRFKVPKPAESWEGIRDATTDGNVCPQYDIGSGSHLGDEDCLYLNVYTKSLEGAKSVLLYIHGGEFIQGGAASYFYDPKYFLEHDLVFVSIQYRLGVLGFLSGGDSDLRGNWGLHDQILALKWVQENIKAFGGDPAAVTLMGESAGGASITYLMLTDEAPRLFKQAIILSGNAMCDQYYQPNPKEALQEIATRLDCASGSTLDLVDCIRRKPMPDIIAKSSDMFAFYSFPRWFTPVKDGLLIRDEPYEQFKKGSFYRVPTVVGHTKDEGAFYYRLILNTFGGGSYDDNFLEDKLPRILPVISHYNRRLFPIMRAVRKRYFGNIDFEKEEQFKPRYIEFLTDLLFTKCTNTFAQALANASVPVYTFVLDYEGKNSVVNFQGEIENLGVAHGDELQYLFDGVWGEDITMPKEDVDFSRELFIPLFVNFAKTSLPTPQLTETISEAWTPFTIQKGSYFHIERKPRLEEGFKRDILKFWSEDIPSLFATAGKSVITSRSKQEL